MRNVSKLKDIFEDEVSEDMSFIILNPLGESYELTRTDMSADISGDSTENLVVIEVIKPIIRVRQKGKTAIVQKGIAVVQDKRTIKTETTKLDLKKSISSSYDGSKKKDRKAIRQKRVSASQQSKLAKYKRKK
jgi:hypothetical protein